MSFSENVAKLLKNGIERITIGMGPQKIPYVQVQQVVITGPPPGNSTQIIHQRENENVGEAMNMITKDVEHCQEMRTRIVQPARPPGANSN